MDKTEKGIRQRKIMWMLDNKASRRMLEEELLDFFNADLKPPPAQLICFSPISILQHTALPSQKPPITGTPLGWKSRFWQFWCNSTEVVQHPG